MLELNDDNLMMLYRDGDVEAFNALFDRHHRAVYHFAWTLLHDSHRASDVLQETFLVLVRRVHNYHPRGHFKTWLLRICRNRCFNILEANKRRYIIAGEADFERIECRDSSFSPEEHIDSEEQLLIIRSEVDSLPERQREAITLYAFESMTYQDISEVLEIPINTVKTLIRRARQTLLVALEKRMQT